MMTLCRATSGGAGKATKELSPGQEEMGLDASGRWYCSLLADIVRLVEIGLS